MLFGKKLILAIVSLTIITSITVTTRAAEQTWGIRVSGGENHTLVLTESNAVWGCGNNGFYQLGVGDDTAYKCTLIRVHDGDMNTASDYLEDINDIVAGWTHSLALDVNGFVWAWGDNTSGQLGDNSDVDKDAPVQVLSGEQDPGDPNSFLQYIQRISAGRSGEHSLALDVNNFVWAWGRNAEGQLGNDDWGLGKRELTPVRVLSGEQDPNASYLKNIVAVSAGEEHSMALEKLDPNDPNCNGSVYTFGDNEYYGAVGRGKLGNGSMVKLSPTPVKVLSGEQDPNSPSSYLKNIVAISAGWDHCMAQEKLDPNDSNCNGKVYTWGNNGEGYDSQGGRLGNGTLNNSSTPGWINQER